MIHRRSRRPQPEPSRSRFFPRWLALGAVGLVVLMMLVSFTVNIINPDHPIPPELSYVFSAVIGAMLYNLKGKDDDE